MTDSPPPPFRADLAHRGARLRARLIQGLAGLAAVLILLGAAGGGAIWWVYLRDLPALPSRTELFAIGRAPGFRFEAADGSVIAVRGPRYGQRVTLAGLPQHVPRAFLAAEDKRFYQHGPVDLYAIVRALWVNARTRQVAQGGSTLSQQLAKGLFLTPQQTLKRKIQEAALAWRLEGMLSKDEVLELYLNRVYFGANAFGIDGAAHTYFGKSARELTVGEAALLAALPKAPSRLSPSGDMKAALARSRLVLATMRETGWITEAEQKAALAAPPKLVSAGAPEDPDFGYALDAAAAEAVRRVGAGAPDLTVRLTIDPRLQKAATEAVQQVIAGAGRKAGARQAALVALSPDGGVRAMVGGVDYRDSPFNRATQALRQPGSSFKPFIYAAALEKGVEPTDIRVDRPIRIGDWAPKNYGGGYAGPMTVESALVNSINTIAVQLAQQVGPQALGEIIRRFGVTTLPPQPNLSAALGAYEVKVIEMASAFQAFQLGGSRPAPYLIARISAGGQDLYVHPDLPLTPTYDPVHASMMVRMMKKVVESGTGARAAFGRPAAGKTGTSQDWRDAWFVGFTPDWLAAVWVGDDDNRPMNRVVGGDLPAEIWKRFMVAAHQGVAARDFPWLVAEPARLDRLSDQPAAPTPDPRNSFYEGLAGEFARAAAEPD